MIHLNGALRYDRELEPGAGDPLARFALAIAPGAMVLDIGCGPGVLGRVAKKRVAAVFDGIERDRAAARRASETYRQVFLADLETAVLTRLVGGRRYDLVVLADVVEHLIAPGRVLRQLPALLKDGGRILISVPNIGYHGFVAELLAGRFLYRDFGILDHTHLRFFTRASIASLFSLNGLEIVTIDTLDRALADTEFDRNCWEALPETVRQALSGAPDAHAFQFLVEARPGGPAAGADSAGALNGPAPAARRRWFGLA